VDKKYASSIKSIPISHAPLPLKFGLLLAESSYIVPHIEYEGNIGLVSRKMISYLPHMEYEGSIDLVTGKMKKKILLIFTFYSILFMAKKHDLSGNFFPSVTRRCCCRS
jgi:hypothetical protein